MTLGELDERQADALVEYFLAVERRRRGQLRAPPSAVPAIDLGARLGDGCRRVSGGLSSDNARGVLTMASLNRARSPARAASTVV